MDLRRVCAPFVRMLFLPPRKAENAAERGNRLTIVEGRRVIRRRLS
jgi:hypothetical protein